jgi:toxin YoeB
MRSVVFTEQVEKDLEELKVNDPKTYEKIERLIENIKEDPYSGLGKPEPLKHNLSGFWSRRITIVHRLVYRVEGNRVTIVQCKGHY